MYVIKVTTSVILPIRNILIGKVKSHETTETSYE